MSKEVDPPYDKGALGPTQYNNICSYSVFQLLQDAGQEKLDYINLSGLVWSISYLVLQI